MMVINKINKTVAIASAGGHWIQLMRLKPAWDKTNSIFITTDESFNTFVGMNVFYVVPDASRWSGIGTLLKMAYKVFKIIINERPDTVISTGAAPGLVGIIAGRLTGATTIWIDSMANIEKISMSGKIAYYFASHFYTQWQHLANGKIKYKGNVL